MELNISWTAIPALFSMTSSRFSKPARSIPARIAPTVDFPEKGGPAMKQMFRSMLSPMLF
jgi:hypothetical protein